MKLTPPKHSTFLFAFWMGIISFIPFFLGFTILAYILAMAALVDILLGNWLEGY
jgi:hypothetical protein